MIQKMKSRFGKKIPGAVDEFTNPIDSQVSETEIYQYRQQIGVNLGSWFVLERWITDQVFSCAMAPAQSDLDVAKGTNAKQILENHWDTWIKEKDWDWISQRGINAVRIPIGYYHICGADPTVLHGTDFQPFHDTFSGAWERILLAVRRAAAYGIGVLIDLHAAPGKQNNDAHAGTSDRANFFGDPHNQNRTLYALQALVENLTSFMQSCSPPLNNFIGVELLNEPNPPSDHALQSWYTSTVSSLRERHPHLPIYLGECWRTESYADYVTKHPSPALTVLDHHLYRCFTSSDIHTSAEDHTNTLRDTSGLTSRMLTGASEKLGRSGGGIVVGEWSGALNPGSLRGNFDEQKNFVDAQRELFNKTCAGSFFWTYKKQHSGDRGWCFREAVGAGLFPNFVGVTRREIQEEDQNRRHSTREVKKTSALAEHSRYWSQYPGSYDHQRFSEGYLIGWNDAYQFMLSKITNSKVIGISRIGFKIAWARRRTEDHGKSYWEFEHGFLQGVADAEEDYQNH